MALQRNRPKFKEKLNTLLEKSSKAAFHESFLVEANEDDNPNTLAERMSKRFAKTFTKELGNDLANLFDDYLDSQGFDVSKLTAGGNPVTGIIKST